MLEVQFKLLNNKDVELDKTIQLLLQSSAVKHSLKSNLEARNSFNINSLVYGGKVTLLLRGIFRKNKHDICGHWPKWVGGSLSGTTIRNTKYCGHRGR